MTVGLEHQEIVDVVVRRRCTSVRLTRCTRAVGEALDQAIADGDLVLDIGGWAEPYERADWVLDLMPYETRGLYGRPSDATMERFSAATWIQADMCAIEPWPFEDDQFDFAICAHTLEDVRDPLRVCAELSRVAKAGYIEVPSRLEEQTWGVEGPWVGRTHHRWLVDVVGKQLEFTCKVHQIHTRPDWHFPAWFLSGLSLEDRIQRVWWDGSISAMERLLLTAEETQKYLGSLVEEYGPRRTVSKRLRARITGWRRQLARRP